MAYSFKHFRILKKKQAILFLRLYNQSLKQVAVRKFNNHNNQFHTQAQMSDAKDILRDRYLQLWLNVVKETPKVKLHMHGGITVEGKLCATDSENNRFRIEQLESPLGVYQKAVIRGDDIDVIEWNI